MQADLIEKLYCLKRDKVGLYERPHKPVLLLAVIDLIEAGIISDNKILMNKNLETRFKEIFDIVRKEDSKPTIQNPFYYMSGESFWKAKDANGEDFYVPGHASRCPSITSLRKGFAVLSEELFEVLKNPQQRHLIKNALISRYFPKEAEKLKQKFYYPESSPESLEVAEVGPVRSAAFAKIVKQVYDYRCAACGQRILVDKVHFVDAAHLIPFSVSFNDHPSNGMALCKNHHWAMDQNLIAPHPDLYWVISEKLDSRIIDHKPLIDLKKQSIIGPGDKRYSPDKESLEWRVSSLDPK